MCKPSAPAAAQPQPKPEPIQEQTQADAQATKASTIERSKAEGLAGRDVKTGARGLDDSARSRKKTLLGE